jgi:glycosyltransferase involved in cell wall biosynthesis
LSKELLTYSIVVCSDGNRDCLRDLIQDILCQKYLPEEFICIGNNDNNYREKCRGFLNESGIMFVYAVCPPGLVHQRNLGLKLCKSEIVIFMDADLRLDRTYIRNILGVYREIYGNPQ